jgi:hypothetical protein
VGVKPIAKLAINTSVTGKNPCSLFDKFIFIDT